MLTVPMAVPPMGFAYRISEIQTMMVWEMFVTTAQLFVIRNNWMPTETA